MDSTQHVEGPEPGRITQLLRLAASGESAAADQLAASVYRELKAMARDVARYEDVHEPTALVHEAWLRLQPGSRDYENRAHFFGAAATAMRRILVDDARRRARLKRGGGRHAEPLSTTIVAPEHSNPLDVLMLDEVLRSMEGSHPEGAQVVTLRCFGGLTVAEVAQVVGQSASSVERRWRFAKAWLQQRLAPDK